MAALKRMMALAIMPALATITPLAVTPVIARLFGASGWAAVAVGMGVGGLASFAVGLDWPQVGTMAASRAAVRGRGEVADLYMVSLRTRAVAFAVIVVPVGLIAGALAPSFKAASIGMAIATALNAFTATWFFAGIDQPFALVKYEGLVRVGANAVAIVMLLAGAPLESYAVVLILAWVLSVSLTTRYVTGVWWPPVQGGADERRWPVNATRRHAGGTLSRMASNGMLFGAAPIIAVVQPGILATFSAVDRLQKSVLNASQFVPTALVRNVDNGESQRHLPPLAPVITVCALGAAGSAALVPLFNPLLELLFGDFAHVRKPIIVAAAVGVAVAFASRSVLLLAVVPLGEARTAYRIVLLASLVGLLLLPFFADVAGTLGAVVAFAAAEALALVLLCWNAWRVRRRRRAELALLA